MRVVTYIFDSGSAEPHVADVRDRLAERDEAIELHDVATGDDRDAAIRDAMLTVRDAVRIGENPDGIYDDDGNPDFSAGVLITEKPTGRRELRIGSDALDALGADAGNS